MELGQEIIYEKPKFTCMKCGYTTTHNQNYYRHLNSKLNPCKKYKNGSKINLSY
jgi:hypothetical protein